MNKKFLAAAILLSVTIIISFALPKKRYESPLLLYKIKIPFYLNDWRGKDVEKKLNLNDEQYNFMSEIFARAYINISGQRLLLIILNAGNFHDPKVCLDTSGYTLRELDDVEFSVLGRTFKAHAVYTKKGKTDTLIIYWLCVDKKITDWAGQKIWKFWNLLLNDKKVSFMLRLDIPTEKNNLKDSLKLAKEFLDDLSASLPSDQVEYLFGK